MDLGLEAAALVAELLAELLEEPDVDADAGVLHPREHRDQRPLDALVEVDELARRERFVERVGEPGQHRDPTAGLVRTALAVEVERALDLVGRRELEREVPQREIFELVLPLTGIEQVRHHRGVEIEGVQLLAAARGSAPWRGARRAADSRGP